MVKTSPRAPSRIAPAVLAIVALPLISGCNATGPSSIASGRALYNDVITRTGDEQVLGMIVKHRYDETFGMLDVASVTSQVTLGVNSAINARAGANSDDTAGNLVPFAAGISYSESPTISYVPMSGEEFMTRLVAPVSLTQTLTLGQLSRVPGQAFMLMVKRINGLTNEPDEKAGASFRHVGDLFRDLRARGVGDFVISDEGHYLLLHDYKGVQDDPVRDLLQTLHLTAFEADGRELLIPIRPGLGSPAQGDAIVLETRSVLDLVRMAGDAIDIPESHLNAGIVAPPAAPASGASPFIHIRSASDRPDQASIAVEHRGWWFFIDPTDTDSRRDFVLLRAVISMGLETHPKGTVQPVLTLSAGAGS
ncbi:MAG TPA: hypothetical protein VFF36_12385 [Planctomycetota bacterium]|nr:hypothetical protein [Planctomycetota bacterium]